MRPSSLLFVAVVVLSVALMLAVITPAISLDDPFIGLRYARNLVAGHGLVYNAGEAPVEGYTAFLWVVVAALGMALGFEPLGFWQVLAIPAAVVTLWATYRAGWLPGRERRRALVAPALLGVHVAFVLYPMTGMETTFLTLLVTLTALVVASRAYDSGAGAVVLGLLLLLICLTRFDGVGLAGLAGLWVLVVDRRPARLAIALVPLALGLAVYHGWRLDFYGDPLPNTFYAKTYTLSAQLARGVEYVGRFLARGGPFALLALAPFVLRGGRASRTVKLAAWLATGHALFVVAAGGDWMPYYRFLLPILPLLCLLVQETLWAALAEARRRWPAAVTRSSVAAALAMVLALGALPLLASTYVRRPPTGGYWHPLEAREVARSLSGLLPPDALVAVEWAGIIPFYLDRQVLDIFGLSDKEITSGEFPGAPMGRAVTPEFLSSRAPDLVLYTTRPAASAGAAAAIDPGIRGEELWITGFYRSLTEPGNGFEPCVLELSPRRYLPVLARRGSEIADRLCRDSRP